MKVLHIIDSLCAGGAEKVCVDLCNLLYSRGVDVSILTVTELGELTALLNPGIVNECLNRRSKFDLKAMLLLKNMLREYDVVHVHMRFTYQYVKLIDMLFFAHSKIILHDHFGRINIDQSVPLLLSTLLKPVYYIGVSSELTDWAKKKLKLKHENVFLLENIVVQGDHHEYLKNKAAVLVSNFSRVKNHLFAIKLIERSEFNLDIYGNVVDEVYYRELNEYVLINGLSDRIKFIHHEINIQKQLRKYMFGLHTAISESGPLVLIEFLAQGIPFLAYEVGQVAETIKAELPDFFINTFEIDAWKERIEIILTFSDEQLLSVYSKYFNPDAYAKNCQKVYEKILAS